MNIAILVPFLLFVPRTLTWNANRKVKWINNMHGQKAAEEVSGMEVDGYSNLYNRGSGTTPELQKLVISRCKEYQMMHKEFFKSGSRDCEKIYSAFEAAFKHKPGCGVNVKHVTDFIKMTETDLPKDKQMFWSKTYDLAKTYSKDGTKVFTLETSFSGYILDNLNFCGQTDGLGINYQTCPNWYDCNNDHPLSAFWKLASKQFASKVKGQVYVLFDGSQDRNTPPFTTTSIFGSDEIPNLNCKDITIINIWLIHKPGKPVVEKCGGVSLTLLANMLKQRGCKSMCINDPREISGMIG